MSGILLAASADDAVLNMVMKVLAQDHSQVLKAGSSPELLAAFIAIDPDTVIVDMGLPLLHDYREVEFIRKKCRETCIVVISEGSVPREYSSVIDGILVNPLRENMLRPAMMMAKAAASKRQKLEGKLYIKQEKYRRERSIALLKRDISSIMGEEAQSGDKTLEELIQGLGVPGRISPEELADIYYDLAVK